MLFTQLFGSLGQECFQHVVILHVHPCLYIAFKPLRCRLVRSFHNIAIPQRLILALRFRILPEIAYSFPGSRVWPHIASSAGVIKRPDFRAAEAFSDNLYSLRTRTLYIRFWLIILERLIRPKITKTKYYHNVDPISLKFFF